MRTDPPRIDPKQAHLIAQWPAGRPIVCCRFDPKGRFLFCGLESSTIARLNLTDGKNTSFSGGHDSWLFALAFSPSGETCYSGGGEGRVVFWETAAASPRPMRTIDAHKGWVRAIAPSPDGKLLATAGNDRIVRLWDTSTGKLVRELTGHANHIYSLTYHPGGKTLSSGDLLGVIKEWDPSSGPSSRRIRRQGPSHVRGRPAGRFWRRARHGVLAGSHHAGRGRLAQSDESPWCRA